MAKESNRSKVSRDERRGVHLRVPASIAELLPDGELEIEWKVAGDPSKCGRSRSRQSR